MIPYTLWRENSPNDNKISVLKLNQTEGAYTASSNFHWF